MINPPKIGIHESTYSWIKNALAPKDMETSAPGRPGQDQPMENNPNLAQKMAHWIPTLMR